MTNESILNDFMIKHTEAISKMVGTIEAMYLSIQQKEAEKTPAFFRPFTVNVQCATTAPILPLMILPKEQRRASVAISNIGPNDLIFSNKWFDPSTILQQFSDPTHPSTVTPLANQMVEVGFIPSGGAASINATDGLWVYNVGGSNALVSMVESLYRSPTDTRINDFPIPGLDGAIGAGYGTVPAVDGSPILQKGLK